MLIPAIATGHSVLPAGDAEEVAVADAESRPVSEFSAIDTPEAVIAGLPVTAATVNEYEPAVGVTKLNFVVVDVVSTAVLLPLT